MNDDLISRQAAIDALDNIKIQRNASWYTYYQQALTVMSRLPSAQTEHATCYLDSPCEYQNINIALPTAEPKKGEWIDALDEDPCYYRCSECGRLSGFLENFCPNCGADMRGEE